MKAALSRRVIQRHHEFILFKDEPGRTSSSDWSPIDLTFLSKSRTSDCSSDLGRIAVMKKGAVVTGADQSALGWVIMGKSSLRKGVTGRPSVVKRLQTGLSAQA
jgi:hypothetical protein